MPSVFKAAATVILLLLMSLHEAMGAQLYVIGKHKPAKQSSNYPDVAELHPVTGNDGVTDEDGRPAVIHTGDADPLPWWMLDMQQIYPIYGARVWNRINCCSSRFTQISIGVSSNSSVWSNFSTGLFDLCTYWTGVPTAAENPMNFSCSRPIYGQYLAVYMNISGIAAEEQFLHFCEIDIWAIKKTNNSLTAKETEPSFSPTSSSLITDEPMKMRSEADCVIQCMPLPNCLFVLFRAANLDCWLFSSASILNSFISVYNNSGATFLVLN